MGSFDGRCVLSSWKAPTTGCINNNNCVTGGGRMQILLGTNKQAEWTGQSSTPRPWLSWLRSFWKRWQRKGKETGYTLSFFSSVIELYLLHFICLIFILSFLGNQKEET